MHFRMYMRSMYRILEQEYVNKCSGLESVGGSMGGAGTGNLMELCQNNKNNNASNSSESAPSFVLY